MRASAQLHPISTQCAFHPLDPPCGKPWHEHFILDQEHRWTIDPTSPDVSHLCAEMPWLQIFCYRDTLIEDW